MVIVGVNKTTTVTTLVVSLSSSTQANAISNEIKRHCLTLYVDGMGFRAIERCMGVSHNTVINWVKQCGLDLGDAPQSQMIPELAQVDELQTFVGSKKTTVAKLAGKECKLERRKY